MERAKWVWLNYKSTQSVTPRTEGGKSVFFAVLVGARDYWEKHVRFHMPRFTPAPSGGCGPSGAKPHSTKQVFPRKQSQRPPLTPPPPPPLLQQHIKTMTQFSVCLLALCPFRHIVYMCFARVSSFLSLFIVKAK